MKLSDNQEAIDKVKKYMTNSLTERELKALKPIVDALYFADSSDYQTALWQALDTLANGLPEGNEEDFVKLLFNGIEQLENN